MLTILAILGILATLLLLWMAGVVVNTVLVLRAASRLQPKQVPALTWRDVHSRRLAGPRRALADEIAVAGFEILGWRREGDAFGGVWALVCLSPRDATCAEVWRFAPLWPFWETIHVSLVGQAADGTLVHTGAAETRGEGIDSRAVDGDWTARLASHVQRMAQHGGPGQIPAGRAGADHLTAEFYRRLDPPPYEEG